MCLFKQSTVWVCIIFCVQWRIPPLFFQGKEGEEEEEGRKEEGRKEEWERPRRRKKRSHAEEERKKGKAGGVDPTKKREQNDSSPLPFFFSHRIYRKSIVFLGRKEFLFVPSFSGKWQFSPRFWSGRQKGGILFLPPHPPIGWGEGGREEDEKYPTHSIEGSRPEREKRTFSSCLSPPPSSSSQGDFPRRVEEEEEEERMGLLSARNGFLYFHSSFFSFPFSLRGKGGVGGLRKRVC